MIYAAERSLRIRGWGDARFAAASSALTDRLTSSVTRYARPSMRSASGVPRPICSFSIRAAAMRTSGETAIADGLPDRTDPRGGPYANPPVSRASTVRSVPTAATSDWSAADSEDDENQPPFTASQRVAAVASAAAVEEDQTTRFDVHHR